jgi:hypothetical protein
VRLNIISWLESHIVGKEPAKVTLGNLTLEQKHPSKEEMSLNASHVDVVDYRLHLGVRVKVRNGDHGRAHQRVFEMMCREVFGELEGQIVEVVDWAFKQGYDQEIISQIQRLARLSSGRDV